MYINSLFLLLFWCLGWAQFGFINSLYLIILLLVGLLFGCTHRKAMTALLVFFASQFSSVSTYFHSIPPPMGAQRPADGGLCDGVK